MDRLTAMANFVKVVESGSFAAAAAATDFSPAMIGNHIRFLEQRLGEPLLNRSTRRQVLTDCGREYYQRCRHILQEVEAAEAACSADTVPSGRLRVTAPVILGTTLLPDAITRYVRENARMAVDLVLHDDRLDLLTERLDLAFRLGALPNSALVQRALPPIRFALCAAPDYLDRRGRPATPTDLAGHACLDFFTVGTNAWRFGTSDNAITVPISGPARVNSGQAMRMLALAGLGIARLPRPVVQGDLAEGTLCELVLDQAPEPLALHLIALPGRMDTLKVRAFIDIITEEISGSLTHDRPAWRFDQT